MLLTQCAMARPSEALSLGPVKPLSLASLPLDRPSWLVAIVIAALALHIGAGALGIASGYAAILAPKGGPLHRRAGAVFAGAMVAMGAVATVLAIWIGQRGNVAAGALAAYLVATGWMAVRRRPGRTGRSESVGCALAATITVLNLVWGLEARSAPGRLLDGYPAGPYFGLALIAALFAWGDLRMLRKGGLTGAARLTRHVVRMGLSLLMATSFLFVGQQKIMPAALHGSKILLLLGLAPLPLMLFWLVRIRLPRRRAAARLAPAA
jgi:hypothetical protein